jgi:hypothetical protein
LSFRATLAMVSFITWGNEVGSATRGLQFHERPTFLIFPQDAVAFGFGMRHIPATGDDAGRMRV